MEISGSACLFYICRISGILVDKVLTSSGFYECLLKDDAVAEGEITDRMRQRKKMMLHKLCIDMERSEYTSFSMLA